MSARTARRPAKEKRLTREQFVAMDFEPWSHNPDEWEPPSNAQWSKDGADLLPLVRMAWVQMYKTKAELRTMSEELDDETLEFLVNGIVHWRKYFEAFVTLLTAAETRMLIAGGGVVLEREKAARSAMR